MLRSCSRRLIITMKASELFWQTINCETHVKYSPPLPTSCGLHLQGESRHETELIPVVPTISKEKRE